MRGNFTIRVYGLMIDNNQILLSEEVYGKVKMTKFPGGGLEFGEGTVDCLIREMKEEFNFDVEVGPHFFTTDFFVQSAFDQNIQVISIYYMMKILTSPIPVNEVFEDEHGNRRLIWMRMSDLNAEDLTFPIDQKVIKLLKNRYL